MEGITGLPDWLTVAAEVLIVVLFGVFFFLVIRLWRHLAGTGCAYNPAKSPGGGKESGTGSSVEPEKSLTDRGNRT